MSHPNESAGPQLPPAYGGDSQAARRHRLIVAVLLADVILIPGALGVWAYNAMASRTEAVDAAWAQVESNMQRRADLVPQLVASVNRYVRHEQDLLSAVTRERSNGLASAREAFAALEDAQRASARERVALAGAPPADAGGFAELDRREAAVTRGVRLVLALSEDYPELRSADHFLALQAQLEGNENRINVARMAFNDAVRDYNAALVKLPTSLVAGARALERRPYFAAAPAAQAPVPLAFE